MLVIKEGLITYIEKTERGHYIRLNSRTWCFVPSAFETGILEYGNTVRVSGRLKYNGRRNVLIAKSVQQIKPCDLQKNQTDIPLTVQQYGLFVVYLKLFKKSLYEKFVNWPYSRQSEYAMNPYKLYINGYLDYHTAKALADVSANVSVENALPAILRYLAEEALNEGRYYSIYELFEKVKLKYQVSENDIIKAFKKASLVVNGTTVIPAKVFHAKKICMKMLQQQKHYPLSQTLKDVLPHELHEIFTYRYACLTGKGGTGKTTVISRLKDIPGIIIASTTGKSAQRLNTKTIHSMLGFGKDGFKVNKLDCELLILDESSMLNWWTLRAVLVAAPRVLFVGATDQLRSPGSEDVFGYLTKVLPTYTLNRQYRQIDHKIINRELTTPDSIVSLYLRLKERFQSVQIITVTRIGPYGSEELNRAVMRCIAGSDSSFYAGCRVIVKENVYDGKTLIASNGTTGTVETVEKDFCMIKTDNGNTCWLKNSYIEPAYALTAHRCQGLEWDYVIAVIPESRITTEELKEVMLGRAKITTYVFSVSK